MNLLKVRRMAPVAIALALTLAVSCAPAAPTPAPPPSAPSAAPLATPTTLPAPQPTAARPVAPQPPTPAPPPPTPASQQPVRGGILKAYQYQEISTMDVGQENAIAVLQAISSIYSSLVRFDPAKIPAQVIEADAAEKWSSSADGLVWTFTLRQGLKFHDGTPATSADVAFSFDRAINPPQGVKSPLRDLFATIKSIETPDPTTVKITLKRPVGWFMPLLVTQSASILPKHLLEKNPNAFVRTAVGTGPFKLKRFTPSVSVEIERNPDYHMKGYPYLDGVTTLIIPDAATRLAAFRTHQVSITGVAGASFTPSELAIAQKEIPGLQVFLHTSNSRFEMILNMRQKPFDDIRVRQALTTVVDQSLLIDAIDGGGYKGGYMAPGAWSLSDADMNKLPAYRGVTDTDITKAKQLLADAGYGSGLKALWITRRAAAYDKETVAVMGSQLRKIGLTLTFRDVTYPGEWVQTLREGKFDITHGPYISAMYDPDDYLQSYTYDGVNNYSGIKSAEIDALYQKQTAATDPVARKKLTDEMQLKVADLAPGMVTWHVKYWAAAWPEVRGYTGPGRLRDNLTFVDVWLAR